MQNSKLDGHIFMVSCKKGKESEIIFAISSKQAYFLQSNDPTYKMTISSAFHNKKKYPGIIFVEATSKGDVFTSLKGTQELFLSSVKPVDLQFSSLVNTKSKKKYPFAKEQYVRIKKGIYEGDLGMILKTRNYGANVAVVPRINIHEILIEMAKVKK